MTTAPTHQHVLAIPVRVAGKDYTTLTLRRPKVKDLKVFDATQKDSSEMQASVSMIATLADVPVEVIDELDAGDFSALAEALADFFPNAAARSPAAGE